MSDLSIDRLRLQIVNASGHEHRVHGIASRATALIGERLVELGRELPDDAMQRTDSLAAAPVALDLARSDDETCAQLLAASVLDTIRLKVET